MHRKRKAGYYEVDEEPWEVDEEQDEEDRFIGVICKAEGTKMWVECDNIPPDCPQQPPKINHKSKAPAGLRVGSWITFNLVDEWPGENWGSLLCTSIQHASPPAGVQGTTSSQPRLAKHTKTGQPPSKAVPIKNAYGTSRQGALKPVPGLAAAAEQLRAARNSPSEPGIGRSNAVAQFRKAQQFGQSFKGKTQTQRQSPQVARCEPFQRAFLEPSQKLSKREIIDMNQKRAAMDISVELPFNDTFPPLENFADLEGVLPDYAFASLANMGIENPMPIQAQALPLALAGMDLVGIAKTGSGKTLAYLLPALPHIEAQEPLNKQPTPIALVLAPTRELAVQISDEAKKVLQTSRTSSAHPGGLGAAVFYGGGSGSKGWQVAEVKRCGHIVAATPGRLIDVMDSGEVSLQRVTYFVLDEADRMLEEGFGDQVGKIARAIRSDRQTLFFSATWPADVQDLARHMCSSDEPARVMVGQRSDGDGPASREDILQEVVVFNQSTWEERDAAKQELLYAHLREVLVEDAHKMLVFVSRKSLADELAKRLWGEGFQTNTMHGGKSQDSRLATLEEFRTGQIKLLVCTDVMGRGLDIPGISHVVIYDMGEIDDYVHRIGRTARGPYGEGHALTLFEHNSKYPEITRQLAEVLEQSGQEVPEDLQALALGQVGWR